MGSIPINTAQLHFKCTNEKDLVLKMAEEEGYDRIYKYTNQFSQENSHTDYLRIKYPDYGEEKQFLNNPDIRNVVALYKDREYVGGEIQDNRKAPASELKITTGAAAMKMAVKNKVTASDPLFAAVLIEEGTSCIPDDLPIKGRIRCHGCHKDFSFEINPRFGCGLWSDGITCPCGSIVSVMSSRISEQQRCLLFRPHSSLEGQLLAPLKVGVTLESLSEEGSKPAPKTQKWWQFWK